MNQRIAQLALITVALGLTLVGGCPPETTVPDTTITLQSGGSGTAGSTVSLTARVTGEYNATQYTYSWYQTYGRRVTLTNSSSATPTFVAPDVSENTTLIFRVDLIDPAGQLYSSEEITVSIAGNGQAGGNSNGNDNSDTGGKVRVRMVTSKGDIVIDLDRANAPISVDNFLQYADDGFYENTIFHRVIPNFVVQGGGFTADLEQKPTRPTIVNEASNGLKNLRGTISMARQDPPDSATSQFFLNLKDNSSLDKTATFPGYAVFGAIVEGLSVIDDIADDETGSENGLSDVPVTDVFILSVRRE